IEPFCSSGMRVRDVVGTNSTLTPSFLAKASARSGPKPTGFPEVSIEPIGGKSLRTPASILPAALTLASVSPVAIAGAVCARADIALAVAPSAALAALITVRLLICLVISFSQHERFLFVIVTHLSDVKSCREIALLARSWARQRSVRGRRARQCCPRP